MIKKISNKGIYWDKAWTLVEQCIKISEGCLHCWSETIDKRFGKPWTGNIRIREDRLYIPLKTKKPTVFAIWNDFYSLSFAFDDFRIRTYAIMEKANQHTYLILTKRAKALYEYFKDRIGYREHIWHGVSCENQQRTNERIPCLLKVPGKRFLSLEPLLGEINLKFISYWDIDWIVVGCETGPKRRYCKLEWIESIVQQCKFAGIPVFVKAIQDLDSKVIKDMKYFPEELRVRELPWKKVK